MDRRNLSIDQGADWASTISVFNNDGTPADLTGSTAVAQIRKVPPETDLLADIEILMESPNILMSLSESTIDTIQERRGVWDIKLTSPAGVTTKLAGGVVVINQGVTR